MHVLKISQLRRITRLRKQFQGENKEKKQATL